MTVLVFLFVISFTLTLLLTPVFRNLARRIGWVDVPGGRKIHASPVPRVGGVAVFISYSVTFVLLAAFLPVAASGVQHPLYLIGQLLPAAGVVFLTGLLDDRYNLRPWQKLAGQVAGAVLACAAGVRVESIGETPIPPSIGVPLTLVWLIACTNAFNLIDGLDGLAAGIGLFATLATLAAAVLQGDWALALAIAPLAGALGAFLRFNFNPATVFLGDGGSLWVGFLLGCYSVIWLHKSATLFGMTAPLMAMAVPLCDTILAVVRRFLRSTPIFGADRGHIHHRLLDRGLTPRRAVLLLYGVSGIAACFALLQSWVSNQLHFPIFIVFCTIIWAGIQRLGYEEFRALSRLLRFRLLRGLLHEELQLKRLADSLSNAGTCDDCWRAVRNGARDLGFCSVSLQLCGNTYQEQLRENRRKQWEVQIPLAGSDYVRLTREFESQASGDVIAAFADFIYCDLGRQRILEGTGEAARAMSAGKAAVR